MHLNGTIVLFGNYLKNERESINNFSMSICLFENYVQKER